MTSLPLRLVLATALSVASTGAMAQALQWQVSEAAGPVTIRHAGADRPATRGAILMPGDAISTGVGARAVLVHERDFVTLAPRSRTTVPVADQASGFTKLLQDLGNAVYKIEKRGVPHFGVTTPYLAAVVKGTTFSVTVDTSGTSLQVVEGAVEVATPDGGARDLIRPGSVATIAAGDLFRLRVHGDEDRVVDSAARPGGDAPSGPAAGDAGATAAPASQPMTSTASDVVAMAANDVVITAAIISKPADLGAMSGGLMSGAASVGALTAAVSQAARSGPLNPAPVAASVMPVMASVDAGASAGPIALAVAAPVVASPVVAIAATTPTVVAPVVVTAPVVVAAITPPIQAVAVVATPVVVGAVTTPTVVAPVVTAPVVVAAVTTPTVVAPVVTTPVVVAAVTTPVVTTPVVVAAVVTAPAVIVPAATAPVVTAPVVTTAAITAPAITTPVVTPAVVVKPVVTVPVVTLPIVSTIINAINAVGDDLSGKGNNGNHYGWSKNGKGG